MSLPELARCEHLVRKTSMGRRAGLLTHVVGLTIECSGLQAGMGELCAIRGEGRRELLAEVVGFRQGGCLLLPLGEPEGLQPGARVFPLGRSLGVPCGSFLLGRVVDALGRPIDGKSEFPPGEEASLHRAAPEPLERVPISDSLPTGISVLDGFLTLGRGQRIGIFAGSGVGKSTLLADVAQAATSDINVIALIGERGREVRTFIEETLSEEARARSIVVVATSDAPPFMRMKAVFSAIAIAEHFRDHGNDVVLMVDSVTRIAGAMREIGLALGEPPTVKGYPPSFFSTMPRLVERLGRTKKGSITGILTILVDADDLNEPVSDTLRGLLDGHIVLSRSIAHRGQFPAVDVLGSTSRVMGRVVAPEHKEAAAELRALLGVYEDMRDLISVGAYRAGADPKVDRAIAIMGDLERFMAQGSGDGRDYEETVARLLSLARSAGFGGGR